MTKTKNVRNLSLDDALRIAKKAFNRGELMDASQLYRAVLEAKPDHLLAKKMLSKIERKSTSRKLSLEQGLHENDSEKELTPLINYFNSGEFEMAEKIARKLLRSGTESTLLFNLLGVVLYQKGSLEEAVSTFKRGISLDSSSADSYCNLAKTLSDLGRIDDALEKYDLR